MILLFYILVFVFLKNRKIQKELNDRLLNACLNNVSTVRKMTGKLTNASLVRENNKRRLINTKNMSDDITLFNYRKNPSN